jgi:2-oxoglutarate ferredoxin oxidoreductase subunit alpha
MATRDLVMRVGGESGEGVVTIGDIFARICAFTGMEVYTFQTFPAEILGGHVIYQVRLGERSLRSRGDRVDVLVTLNEEGFETHTSLLDPDGVLVYDSNELAVPEDLDVHCYGIPLSDLAKEMQFVGKGKNIIAIGALCSLFGLPLDLAEEMVRRRLGKRKDILPKNLEALGVGYRWVADNVTKVDTIDLGELAARGRTEDRLALTGNNAVAMGALAAGMRFYAGYPITPASDIMEFLAAQLPRANGTLVQAEDEMAALAMCIGAGFGGAKAMTATSGPGLSLMVELLGLASMTETPLVIIDVQRAGPSTGMPTKTSQSDLSFALHAGHDETSRVVVAPLDVEDCYYGTILAFNLAERYQVPAILLSEQSLSARIETVPVFETGDVELLERILPALDGASSNGHRGNGHEAGEPLPYRRYAYTESGISPMSLPGMPGGHYTAEGLEHVESGAPNYEPLTHMAMTEKRFRKMRTLLAELRAWGWELVRRYGDDDPEVLVLGWGSTWGPACDAVDLAREQGISAAALFPRILAPLPEDELRAALQGPSLRHVLVPEVNYLGQYAELLKASFFETFRSRPEVALHQQNIYGGLPFTAREIFRAVERAHRSPASAAREVIA